MRFSPFFVSKLFCSKAVIFLILIDIINQLLLI